MTESENLAVAQRLAELADRLYSDGVGFTIARQLIYNAPKALP